MKENVGSSTITVKKSTTVESYSFYFGHNFQCRWSIFTIDEAVGSLQIMSDFGDWSYMWGSHGRKSFKHFLLELEKDSSYLVMKLGMGKEKELDLPATIKAVKNLVIDSRRNRDIDGSRARNIWDDILDLEKLHNPTTSDQFYLALTDGLTELSEFIGGECEPPTVMSYSYHLKRFVAEVYPQFTNYLRKELTNEENADLGQS